MMKTVLGVFQDRADVGNAIDRFKSEGFKPQDFSIVMKDTREAEELQEDTGIDVAGGTVSGATTGAVVGGLAGLLAGIAIPGLGAFLIGGPIAAALGLTGAAASTVSGAATGAVAGGLIGALTGLGLSEDEAEYYENRVKEGAILLAVPCRENQVDLVMSILADYNAADVKMLTHPSEVATSTRLSSHKYRGEGRQYAHMGAKGGRGWHGEPEEHAAAAKGKHTKIRSKTK